MATVLRVLNGPLSKQRFNLNQDRIVIGRDSGADVNLAVDGASREHVELRIEGRHITIRDLDSRNGTSLNGEPLTQTKELHPQDYFTICGCHLTLCDTALRDQVRIQVVAGDRLGHEFPLHEVPFSIGRSKQTSLPLADKSASRVHAIIKQEGKGYCLHDGGSRNGILLNGERIERPTLLRSSDRFQVGDTVFEFIDGRIEDLTGTVIEGHTVLERIGSGTMGVVYRAKALGDGRPVAVKFFDPAVCGDETERLRLENAVRNVSRIEDEHLLPVLDHGTYRDMPYMVTAWAERGSLADLIRPEQDHLPPPEVTTAILRDAAMGLRTAAAGNVYHQALRPSNLLITSEGKAWVSDLLTAQHYQVDQAAGGVYPYYIAPEEADGQASDMLGNQFSLGCIGYYALTGHPPFDVDEHARGVGNARLTEKLPAIEEFNQSVPRPLIQIIDRMMAREADDRYDDWDDVIADLEKVLRYGEDAEVEKPHQSVVAPQPRSRIPRRNIQQPRGRGARVDAARQTQERPRIAGLVVLLVILLAVAVAFPFVADSLKDALAQGAP